MTPPNSDNPAAKSNAPAKMKVVAGGGSPLGEILVAAKAWPVWMYLSLNDIRAKYRRASLGPLWLVIGMGIAMTGMAAAWSIIFKIDWRTYIPYMVAGMLSWQLISNYIVASCDMFTHEFNSLVRSLPSPPIIYVFRFVMRGFWMYLHYLPFWILVMLVTGTFPTWNTLVYFPIGLFLVMITALSVTALLGMASARFRDLSPAVSALMMPAMLMTPVMWKTEMLGEYGVFATINPLTHYLEILRAPLMGEAPDSVSLMLAMVLTSVFTLAALWAYRKYRYYLVFWL